MVHPVSLSVESVQEPASSVAVIGWNFFLPVCHGMVGKVLLPTIFSPAQAAFLMGQNVGLPVPPGIYLLFVTIVLCHGKPLRF